ncbi:MAG: bifunctional metallophosphatase/5'-nucleotidase [Alistipes sp.]|nr:bifunctional metallophosphatase/5'-nucleotidase [Alistipes sp.]
MKRFFILSFSLLLFAAACFGVGYGIGSAVRALWGERTVVVLSTNDIHAKIDNFPRLAAAVEMCRDTVPTVLVDAGDRWTGNAFVDLADEPRRPVIDLMNRLGYDVGTFGNHEFDPGQAYLDRMVALCDFPVVCANLTSDTASFVQPKPYAVVECGGVKLGFLGVVTNYGHNGHPDGNDACFEGLTFPDPQQAARDYAARLAAECDVPIVLSHMGDDKDMELAASTSAYPLVIGGHTHRELDTLVNGVRVVQTGKNLKNVGVTTLRFRGRRLKSADYRNVPLADYAADPVYDSIVGAIKSNPVLLAPIGTVAADMDKTAIAAFETRAIAEATGADVVFYHNGGIRLDRLPAGGVSTADIYDLEPFSSTAVTVVMTPEQMERMIVAKYNDTKNAKESHRVDLFSNVPYHIAVDSTGEATGVVFDTLERGRAYRVAMCNYILNNYDEVECREVCPEEILVTDILIDYLRRHSPVAFSGRPLQDEWRVTECR